MGSSNTNRKVLIRIIFWENLAFFSLFFVLVAQQWCAEGREDAGYSGFCRVSFFNADHLVLEGKAACSSRLGVQVCTSSSPYKMLKAFGSRG